MFTEETLYACAVGLKYSCGILIGWCLDFPSQQNSVQQAMSFGWTWLLRLLLEGMIHLSVRSSSSIGRSRRNYFPARVEDLQSFKFVLSSKLQKWDKKCDPKRDCGPIFSWDWKWGFHKYWLKMLSSRNLLT